MLTLFLFVVKPKDLQNTSSFKQHRTWKRTILKKEYFTTNNFSCRKRNQKPTDQRNQNWGQAITHRIKKKSHKLRTNRFRSSTTLRLLKLWQKDITCCSICKRLQYLSIYKVNGYLNCIHYLLNKNDGEIDEFEATIRK